MKEPKLADPETTSYDNLGELGAALDDFKRYYVSGLTAAWPKYWKEFASQAFADVLSLEFRLKEAEREVERLKKKLKKVKS